MEWAGAFGDLGTLIPFVLAYITVLGVEPVGLLWSFGLAKVAAGLIYKTPIPIQPMKAIGAASVARSTEFIPATVWGAGLFTGLVWLFLGLTGIVSKVTALAPRPVVQGIVLGLGLSFMLEGIEAMQTNFFLASVALIITLAFISNRKFPVMFLLLALGIGTSLVTNPGLLIKLKESIGFYLPEFTLTQLTWPDLVRGAVFLALPQIPLTLGNAVIAIVAENNELFPHRPVTERQIALSTGIMNLVAPLLGGVPMCHGAGGMAGHVRFGARTGGSLVILGSLVIVVAFVFGQGVGVLLQLFPSAILGVILFFAGAELAATARLEGSNSQNFYLAIITAGLAMWNMGAAFLVGVSLNALLRKGWIKF